MLKQVHTIGVHKSLEKVMERHGNQWRYKEGYSNDRVAEEYGHGVTRWNVDHLRKEMFPNGQEEDCQEQIDNLKLRVTDLEDWATAKGFERDNEQ